MRVFVCVLFASLAFNAVADTGLAFKTFKDLKGKWTIKSGDKILPFDMT